MSRVLPNQTNITPNDAFFLRATVSTLVVNNIQTSNINTQTLTAGIGSISSFQAHTISTSHLNTESISSQYTETNYAEISSIFVLDGFISSFITNNIILDGNTLDTGGAGFGSVLLLNGLPIATGSSTLSSIQDWSFFPAISTLQMSGNNINNAGNITCQNIYNALNIQTDTLASLTSLTAPTAVTTNLRTTNLSSVNTVSSNATIPTLNATTFTTATGRFTSGLSSLAISTGSINGSVPISGSNWSQYPAIQTVNLANNTLSNTSNVTGTVLNLSATGGNLGMTASNDINMTATDVSVTADGGVIVSDIANINLTAQNGNRGAINLTANSGFNNGVAGQIILTANGGQVAGVGTGGTIELNANTPLGFSNLTSKISLNASGVNSYAGSIPAIASVYGYNFLYGQNGVNICAGLPPVFPNVPFTTFIYGTAGVEIPSNIYALDIQPYWDGVSASNGDLAIHGRTINLTNNTYVTLSNVKRMDMEFFALINNVKGITFSNGYSNNYISNADTIQGSNTISGYNTISATNLGFTTATGTTVNSSNLNTSNILASNLVSTTALNLSSINGFTSFGTKSIRVLGDVAQIQLSNNNVSGSGTILNLLSRVDKSEIQSFNSNFTTPLPLLLNSAYTSTTALFCSTINGQALPYAYGSFTANATQLVTAANTATDALLDRLEIANGIVLSGASNSVVVDRSGVYRVLASPQFATSSGGVNIVDFWITLNGSAVARTNSQMSIQNNGQVFTSVEVILSVNSNDRIGCAFGSSDSNMALTYYPPGVVGNPETPALILNLTQIAS